ncbi:plasmid recombination protein [Paenirhodobacter populi]|uniref:plasmid recombination protein n=1 Tax=Paenirhodobacter populi TaxID=2306993 RepID=UPI000FE4998A|nr:hypothetical protein D2T32_21175 [Sinirhodobacter populi]
MNPYHRFVQQARRQRKIKSNAAVVLMGVITFGHMAAEEFNTLPPEQQDQAFRKLAEEIAAKLKTTVESLVVHLDETTIHAHFMLRGYDDDGNAVSDAIRLRTTSEIQDMTHAVMSGFCPGIERGRRKRDRLEAGADYADTLHRSVRQLHQDIPAASSGHSGSFIRTFRQRSRRSRTIWWLWNSRKPNCRPRQKRPANTSAALRKTGVS